METLFIGAFASVVSWGIGALMEPLAKWKNYSNKFKYKIYTFNILLTINLFINFLLNYISIFIFLAN